MLDARGQDLTLGRSARQTWNWSPAPCRVLCPRAVCGGCRERLSSVFIKLQSTEGNRVKDQSGPSLPVLSSRKCPQCEGRSRQVCPWGLWPARTKGISDVFIDTCPRRKCPFTSDQGVWEGEARLYWRKQHFQHLGKASTQPALEAAGQHASLERAWAAGQTPHQWILLWMPPSQTRPGPP